MSTIEIRPATEDDAQLILHFIRELADYEKALAEVEASKEDIALSIFGNCSCTRAVICEIDDEPVGFAVYFFNYSTWLGRNGLYLEDLYVSPVHRGKGAGKKLLAYLAKEALEKDCGRFEWRVLDWNRPSIDFYESLGAVSLREWVNYRLSGEPLKNLAEEYDRL